MAIGEFGGAARLPGKGGLVLSTPMYWFYEMSQAALNPSRAFADATKLLFKNPLNPMALTTFGKSVAAACEVFERSTRRYGRPEWHIKNTLVGGERGAGARRNTCGSAHSAGCCTLRARSSARRCGRSRAVPTVAPMSGHYSTLLRGTARRSCPIMTCTSRIGACPPGADYDGRFDLDDYIDYVISIIHFLGGDIHVIAVCQPSVPVLAAVARMEAEADPYVPYSMVLLRGPIDTRVNPTGVDRLAQHRGVDWFRRNVITKVPFPIPGLCVTFIPGSCNCTVSSA